jgi:hypothetical protein
MSSAWLRRLYALVAVLFPMSVVAQPTSVEHAPSVQAFGETAGVTQREPEVPREDEAVELFIRVSFQFAYDRVAVYYTTNGSTPAGTFGTGNVGTLVLSNTGGQVTFVRNEGTPEGTRDWWKVTLPSGTRQYGQTIRYKLGAWSTGGGPEVLANGGAAYQYTNKLAWPGAGAAQPNPNAGYPPVNFWKEEAFIGNTYTAAMLDQNGSWWDMYFPTPGGIQGIGTRNEGYSDGPDTFPPLLSSEKRGQMHLNQAQVGIRVGGTTHWLSNPNAVSYSTISQAYLAADSATVRTTQTLTGASIAIEQLDFAPMGIPFPASTGGEPQRHIVMKRMILTNNSGAAQTVNVYLYLDPALNGGDAYDVMFWDAGRGSMTAYDKTRRTVNGTGAFIAPPEEYNITTFNGYEKNIALYLTATMKRLFTVGGFAGSLASDSWRDTSTDDSQGWIGQQVTLQPGTPVEINFTLVGAHFRPVPITGNIPANDGVYDNQIVPVLNWLNVNSSGIAQALTESYWFNWVESCTTVDLPDSAYDRLFKRALITTAQHQDAVNGGIVAGYHNGAYYYVWPRDAMWAAITLARTGHIDEAKKAIAFMRETAYRDPEPGFGTNPHTGQTYKGFWKQKYTTDGYTVWGAPQVDETAVFPWAVKYVYDVTGDVGFVNLNYGTMRDAVLAMTQDSQDTRLYFIDPPGTGPGTQNLMHSNNVWEDSYAPFVFSNANIVRGLRDASDLSLAVGNFADAADATGRANTILTGLDGRLQWDGENTDISMLGIVYPFEVYSPTDARAAQIIDRLNGTTTKFNNTLPPGSAEPLVNFAGFPNDQYAWTGLINRYWGDGYWGGGQPWGAGPWFLSTMWYGCYYAARQDFTAGKSDIDTHKSKLDLLIARLGPIGLGAEQIAPRAVPGDPSRPGSLLYPGQNDFMLQAAWPNAWESMSFFADSIMKFLDYRPDAPANRMVFSPKLPSTWGTMTFRGVTLVNSSLGQTHKVDTTVTESSTTVSQTFTNRSGFPLAYSTTLRIPTNSGACVLVTGGTGSVTARDVGLGKVQVSGQLGVGLNAVTTVSITLGYSANCDGVGGLTANDFACFLNLFANGNPAANCDGSSGNPILTANDFACFLNAYASGCQ